MTTRGERLAFGGSAALARVIFDATGYSPDLTVTDEVGPLPATDGLPALGIATCWENLFEGVFRRQASEGAEAFIVLTNEAGFGVGSEMAHMVAATRWRSVEMGRAVLRVANAGRTVLVDAQGDLRGELPPAQPGFLAARLPLVASGNPTPYVAWGWLLQPALCGIALLLALACSVRRRREPMPCAWRWPRSGTRPPER